MYSCQGPATTAADSLGESAVSATRFLKEFAQSTNEGQVLTVRSVSCTSDSINFCTYQFGACKIQGAYPSLLCPRGTFYINKGRRSKSALGKRFLRLLVYCLSTVRVKRWKVYATFTGRPPVSIYNNESRTCQSFRAIRC